MVIKSVRYTVVPNFKLFGPKGRQTSLRRQEAAAGSRWQRPAPILTNRWRRDPNPHGLHRTFQ